MAKIQYTTPDGVSGEVELTADRMTLGRADDNMIIIDDASVSSHHGEITSDGSSWTLTDLGSTNGTKLGADRVDLINLTNGGKFFLGNVSCVFVGDQVVSAPSFFGGGGSATVSSAGAYSSRAIDRSRRRGFGAKTKEKNSGNGLLMMLGFFALLACGAAIFMFTQMAPTP